AIAAAADASALDRAVTAVAEGEMRLLDRWLTAGQRAALAPLFADEDRRSLRRVLRGLAAGVPAARRAGGALPTPTLPRRLLAAVAQQPSPATVATMLTAAGHGFGAALAAAL